MKEQITYDIFDKVDIRIGTVISVKKNEKARKPSFVIEADFRWNDIGSWKSLFSVLKKNNENNYYDGDIISIQSNNNLIISPNRLTGVIGINNMIIINLEDATLIVPRSQSEGVKEIVKMLETLNKKKYL